MPLAQPILSLDDPRVAGFVNLRERHLRDEGLFITEGALLAERLLQSRFPTQSLLVARASQARFEALAPDDVPLYVAEPALLREIVGFDFHRGVLGLARRTPFPSAADLVHRTDSGAELRLIACPSTETAENLGLILRSAQAFGVRGILLPTGGADPLSRRCLRQSMGSVLSLSIALCENLLDEMRELRRKCGLRLVAAVAGSSQSGVIPLSKFLPPARSVLVVGNEFHGLDEAWLEICDDLVTIPLAPNCDSLNVAVATGVILHHMSNAST